MASYTTLFSKIETTLDKIDRVQDYFKYPKSKITQSPAVFYFPDGFQNSYETGQENMKVYRFRLAVIVSGVKDGELEDRVETMAKTISDVVEQFDADWNMGTIDGHRVWATMDTSEPWQFSEEQDGLELSAQLSLEIRLVTDI